MYWRHFDLSAEPFSLTPDPAFLYLSSVHAEAYAALTVGLRERRGLIAMIGEVGTGKTTLVYSLLSGLGPEIHTAYISNARLSFDGILRSALRDFAVECDSVHVSDLLEAFNRFLNRCAEDGTTAALVIDEAQNLARDTFEDLRLLTNFETYKHKLLQIVLVGQPELDAKLRDPLLRQVADRIAVRCNVNPLTPHEVRQYIQHRLAAAGGSIDIFSEAALRVIIRRSRGIPRSINILGHNAMLFAYGAGRKRVTRRDALSAVREREGRGLVRMEPRLGAWFSSRAADGSRSRMSYPRLLAAGVLVGIAFFGARATLSGREEAPVSKPAAVARPAAKPPAAASASAAKATAKRAAAKAAPASRAAAPPARAAKAPEPVERAASAAAAAPSAATTSGAGAAKDASSVARDQATPAPPRRAAKAPEPVAPLAAAQPHTPEPSPNEDAASERFDASASAAGGAAPAAGPEDVARDSQEASRDTQPLVGSAPAPAAGSSAAAPQAAAAPARLTPAAPAQAASRVAAAAPSPRADAGAEPGAGIEEAGENPLGPAAKQISPPMDGEARPGSVRVIEVLRGTSLYDLMTSIYGSYDPRYVPRIQAMNPQVKDPNYIMAGDQLRFPERLENEPREDRR